MFGIIRHQLSSPLEHVGCVDDDHRGGGGSHEVQGVDGDRQVPGFVVGHNVVHRISSARSDSRCETVTIKR